MSIPTSELILSQKHPSPDQMYGVEIIAAEVKTSQASQKETLRVQCQIIFPLAVEYGGQKVKVVGRKFDLMPTSLDPEAEYGGLPAILEGLKTSKFDFGKFECAEDELPDLRTKAIKLIGHKMMMYLSSFEDKLTRPATKDELLGNPAVKRYPVLDFHGKEISSGWKICSPAIKKNGERISPGWQEVYGPCDADNLLS